MTILEESKERIFWEDQNMSRHGPSYSLCSSNGSKAAHNGSRASQNGSSGHSGNGNGNGSGKGHEPRETSHGEDAGNLGSYDKDEPRKDRPKGTLDQLLDQSRQVRVALQTEDARCIGLGGSSSGLFQPKRQFGMERG